MIKKLKKYHRLILSGFLAFEGIFHFVIPGISLVGMWRTNSTLNWATLLTPLTDIFFGVVCVYASIVLGHDHHHKRGKKDGDCQKSNGHN